MFDVPLCFYNNLIFPFILISFILAILKFHQPTNYARATSRSNEVISEGTNSITNELICLLRQQASGRLMQAGIDQTFSFLCVLSSYCLILISSVDSLQ